MAAAPLASDRKLALRRVRHWGLWGVVVGLGLWLAPIPVLLLLVCGGLDVVRHRRLDGDILEEYFTSKGLVTWLLSPVNLLADALSAGGHGILRYEDLPEGHRREIDACVAAFLEHGPAITARIAETEGQRAMLTFKWFDVPSETGLDIAAFRQPYAQVKTIAVSTFRPRAQTSWHFGPHRLTVRVLRNLEPVESREVFVAVDDQVHVWADDPLLVFDDTLIHRSVNGQDAARYCLFLDVIRPNHAPWLFAAAIRGLGLAAGPFKRVFYRNWRFVR